jgi:uncharacterized protein (TIGR00295 family)
MTQNTYDYPNREECLGLLRDANCPEHVIDHILVVTELALLIAERFPDCDKSLVEAGALLHDIGRSRTHGLTHAVEGAKIVRELGLPDELVNIIERHICAGIPVEDSVGLGLPEKDYTPRTIEERIVAHADNLFEGKKRCKISRSVEILQNQGLPVVAERVRLLHENLSKAAGIDLDLI